MKKDVIVLEENFISVPTPSSNYPDKKVLINNAYVLKKVLQGKIKCDMILTTSPTSNIQKVSVFWKNK